MDNNKVVVDARSLTFDSIVACEDQLAFVSGSLLQFKQVINQDGPIVANTLETNPRNQVGGGAAWTVNKVAFGRGCMVTFEQLQDYKFTNKQICVQALKIWHKEGDGYQLKQFVHQPCQNHGEQKV
jgi:hypothetical protein